MPIEIRKMTDNEFDEFYKSSVEAQAKELSEELHISYEEARKNALAEICDMLPCGINTKNNNLMTIVDGGERVGFIWTLYEEENGEKQIFICDFEIFESRRRKGYGAAALGLAERIAAEHGCKRSVLFVNDNNAAAKALYEKCGYQTLRKRDYGRYMSKRLD